MSFQPTEIHDLDSEKHTSDDFRKRFYKNVSTVVRIITHRQNKNIEYSWRPIKLMKTTKFRPTDKLL